MFGRQFLIRRRTVPFESVKVVGRIVTCINVFRLLLVHGVALTFGYFSILQ